MFSPAIRKSSHFTSSSSSQKDHRNLGRDSPTTPVTAENPTRLLPPSSSSSAIPNRPSTGTPAPWIPRLSVLARLPSGNKTDNERDADPVHVGEFPEELRNAQASFLQMQKNVPSDKRISGGIDRGTSLSWIVYENQLFIWSYLSPAASKHCIVVEIPSSVSEKRDNSTYFNDGNSWMVCIIDWNSTSKKKYRQQSNSMGIIMCNKKSQAIIYWPDIYSESGNSPVDNLASYDGSEGAFSPADKKTTPNSQRQRSRLGSSYLVEKGCFNSFIASAIPGIQHNCVALAAGSDGELWRFKCSPSGIGREKVSIDFNILSMETSDGGRDLIGKGYPRSLIWGYFDKSNRQFLLLTGHEIQCFNICLDSNQDISKIWSHEIIGTDNDLGIKKDLAGQKRIWPLDMQIDDSGKELTVLVATICKDRVSSSSYTQYSLLSMQYKPGVSISFANIELIRERVLEKKAPVQVIIPKARVEDENFLFSMKLRVGGKPSGSVIILSGDGTATVSNYWRNSVRLYTFDLPWDAGKVLDASVFPSIEDGEEGAWVVVTEKAGVWVIPEKAILRGGVEPPERSLSRKGSSNEGAAEQEKRSLTVGGDIAPRRASSEAWDAGERQKAVFTGTTRRTAQDEESEALLGRLFHDFLSSGQVDDSLGKLKLSGAFMKDDETNVFTRLSKSIVDTLAKHWTTTRGAEIVSMTIVSSQLLDKQQKHQKFLQFLALSKCHEELSNSQRHSLQTIMEHGEKLAGMIQLRELQSTLSQNRSNGTGNSFSNTSDEMAGALWDLIQLVGEKARRNTVLLMDRDNAEVFYSKVSDLEEVFYCLSHQLQYIIGGEQPMNAQITRVCEISNACIVIIRTAMQYRTEHDSWYPVPVGLTSWYCQPVVRNGLWSVASFMLELLKESGNWKEKINLHSHLEQMADVVLKSYSGANTAIIERGEEHKGLLDEYCGRRDELLNSLYQHVKDFVDDKYHHPTEGVEESKEDDLRKFSAPLLSIAKSHEGYETLWNLCCDLNDSALLRSLMVRNFVCSLHETFSSYLLKVSKL
ncbi:nuclear pore complex protein [Thalictrum thalictroides]|uniref:Nuclear pore complex protein n=1 Tax=Thalictrum thalictroides TaxID=46969 RepID=A0A7J6V9G9_THATH|nr:nuclear pore complex protein [Thalictrum thalictroides]